jgi:hypothetical protein
MSYAVPGSKPRPGVVTVAAAMLFLLIPVRVTAVVAGLVLASVSEPAILQNATAANRDATRLGVQIGFGVAALFGLILIAGYAVLAAFVLRGNQVARILTWVFGGIGVIVEFIALRPNDFTKTASYLDAAGDTIPGWIRPTSAATTTVTLVALILAVGLLATPPAHDYFRKPPQLWIPPAGYYPPHPYPYQPYPPAAGYPSYPPPVPDSPADAPPPVAIRPPTPTTMDG